MSSPSNPKLGSASTRTASWSSRRLPRPANCLASIVANEGKLVAIVAPDAAESILMAMRAHPLGQEAAIIGEVIADDHRFVQMTTAFGGGRIVDWLSGEQLPRIC